MGHLMTQPIAVSTRPQLALQSYLDDLLFDATEALPPIEDEPQVPVAESHSAELDEFRATMLEEEVRDARAPAMPAGQGRHRRSSMTKPVA